MRYIFLLLFISLLNAQTWELGSELYVQENAVGTDANATTGWANGNVDVFASQDTVTNSSTYAFVANEAGSPTSQCRVAVDIGTACSLSEGDSIQLQIDVQHYGSGGQWALRFGSNSGLAGSVVFQFTDTLATFRTFTHNFVFTAASTRFFGARENNGSNDGGAFLDNFSIKKYSQVTATSSNKFDNFDTFDTFTQ